MSPDVKVPKTCSQLNNLQSKEICEYAEKHPNTKHYEVADIFNKKYSNLQLKRSTVSKLLKKREVYKSITNEGAAEHCFCHRSVKYPTLELAMSFWVQQMAAGGMSLSDQLLQEKGSEFARALNIEEDTLSFSSGWVTKFKRRNQLRRIKLHGEAESAP